MIGDGAQATAAAPASGPRVDDGTVGVGSTPVAGPFAGVARRGAHRWERTGVVIRRRRWVTAVLAVILLVASSAVSYAYVRGQRSPTSPTEQEQPPPSTPAKVVGGPQDGTVVKAGWLAAENALSGTSGWKITTPAHNGEISGYADITSVPAGQAFSLFVSTTGTSFHVEAYRMGYYHGTGGRLLWTSPETTAVAQPRATVAPTLNLVEAGWQPSLRVTTTGWPEGTYLLKLVANTGKEQYVPITLRNDASTAAYVIINAVTTWQAYNLWGGYDLYEGKNGNGSDFAHRARSVSFDRPILFGDGTGDYLGLEYPAVSLAESLGLDVTYLTDVDLNARPAQLLQHRAVFTMGHDEYYSRAIRDALEAARDHGVNLAFLGANSVFRHIRFDSSPLGPDRRIIDYKSAREDPLYGFNNAEVTVSWRDPPNNNPESQLIGNFYQCNPARADMVIVDPSNWLFAGTNAVEGQHLPKVIGSEYDRYEPNVPGPANVEILTHSPVVCHGKSDFADATYYTAASGAGVFASGTIDFVANMDVNCEPVGCGGRVLGKVMANLLAAFGAGPAGRSHPSNPTQSSIRSQPPVTTTSSTVPGTGAGTASTTFTPTFTPTTGPFFRPPVTRGFTTPTRVHRRPTIGG